MLRAFLDAKGEIAVSGFEMKRFRTFNTPYPGWKYLLQSHASKKYSL